jgi:hypothetical protein
VPPIDGDVRGDEIVGWRIDRQYAAPWSFRRSRKIARDQWLIIHGRAVGKLLAPLLVCLTRREGLVEQQPQPGPCAALYSPTVLGALAERSLVAWALRLSDGMQKKFGAVRMTRGDSVSQRGQSCGASHSAIGRMSVKGPQSLQRYS